VRRVSLRCTSLRRFCIGGLLFFAPRDSPFNDFRLCSDSSRSAVDVYIRVCVPQPTQSGFLMLFIDGVDHDAALLVPGDAPANVAPAGAFSESTPCWQAHFARLALEAGASVDGCACRISVSRIQKRCL